MAKYFTVAKVIRDLGKVGRCKASGGYFYRDSTGEWRRIEYITRRWHSRGADREGLAVREQLMSDIKAVIGGSLSRETLEEALHSASSYG